MDAERKLRLHLHRSVDGLTMKRNPLPKYEKNPDNLGDPILKMLEPEEDTSEFWYDFMHLDWKEIVALGLVAAWLFFCVFTSN